MKLASFLIAASAFSLASALPAQQAAKKPSRPNVILIIGDDQGYADLGCQGAKDIPTPNIDSLAKSGIRFTQGYASCPLCSPSRAGIMTGRYQTRFGHEVNCGPQAAPNFGLPTTEKTIANYMKEAGYATGAFGKWHLGHPDKAKWPLHRGFDEFYGFLGGAHPYWPNPKEPAYNVIRRGDDPTSEPRYLTEAFADEACKFIERHKQEPFFLYLPFNAIHEPLQEPAPGEAEKFKSIADPKRRVMATMLASMDKGVGTVLETVRKNHLEDNTLIFYISDNGGPTGGNGSRNTPFSGFKGQMLEGGIRVPFLVQWKGVLPSGKTYEKPVISLDILPTILAATGTSTTAESRIEGVDLLPYLTGKRTDKPHEALFWRMAGQFAARVGDWKWVKSVGMKEPRLFNLAQDVSETSDLSKLHPEKVKELQEAYAKWNAGNVERLWKDSRELRRQSQELGDDAPSSPPARRRAGRKAATEEVNE